MIRKEIRAHEIQAPGYDCNEPPVMDVNRIRELLPHRYPMQLVDKVIELGPTTIVAVKNVTSNEPFFTDGKTIPAVKALLKKMVDTAHRLDPTRMAAVGEHNAR